MSYQIEKTIANNYNTTYRSLDANHPSNQSLKDASGDDFEELLHEVKVRFDTSPKFYLREDYLKLIELLRLAGQSGSVEIIIEGDGSFVTNVEKDGSKLVITKDYELSEDSDVEMIIPLESEMVTDIVQGNTDLLDYSMFTGNSQYIPMTSDAVHILVHSILYTKNS